MSVPIEAGTRPDGRRVGAQVMRAVLVCLAEHARRDTDECHPGWDRIAERTSLSRRTVVYALAALRAAGLVEVVVPANVRPGRRSSTVYRLPVDSLRPVDNGPVDNTRPVHRVHPTGAPGAPLPVHRVHPNRKEPEVNRGARRYGSVDDTGRPSLPAVWLHADGCQCPPCWSAALTGEAVHRG
jgi:DNA-binding transcriptional ArsR family regulator